MYHVILWGDIFCFASHLFSGSIFILLVLECVGTRIVVNFEFDQLLVLVGRHSDEAGALKGDHSRFGAVCAGDDNLHGILVHGVEKNLWSYNNVE